MSRYFARWVKKELISATVIHHTVAELCQGLHDGNLGQHVFKKRIAREGQGKRGAYRSIVAVQVDNRISFIYGYANSGKATISAKEQRSYQRYARYVLSLDSKGINTLIQKKELVEVCYDSKR